MNSKIKIYRLFTLSRLKPGVYNINIGLKKKLYKLTVSELLTALC